MQANLPTRNILTYETVLELSKYVCLNSFKGLHFPSTLDLPWIDGRGNSMIRGEQKVVALATSYCNKVFFQ